MTKYSTRSWGIVAAATGAVTLITGALTLASGILVIVKDQPRHHNK